MKKILITLVCALVASPAFAQTKSKSTEEGSKRRGRGNGNRNRRQNGERHGSEHSNTGRATRAGPSNIVVVSTLVQVFRAATFSRDLVTSATGRGEKSLPQQLNSGRLCAWFTHKWVATHGRLHSRGRLTPAGGAELAQVFDLRQFEQGKLQTCSPGSAVHLPFRSKSRKVCGNELQSLEPTAGRRDAQI